MFKQESNIDLIKTSVRNTRLHDVIIFETDMPNIEKFECNPLHRGAVLWNSLTVDVRNFADYSNDKELS